MSIHTVGKGSTGFSNVESITFSTLQLVDLVHGLTISMGGDGVSDISAELVKELAGCVWGRSYIGSIAESGASGGGSSVGAETCVDNELAKITGSRKVNIY